MRSNLWEICFKTRKPHWCTFYKIWYTGCIFKRCGNFTYEVVGQRRRLKTTMYKKLYIPQKLNVNLFFDRIF
jgi:hypothetical protein